MPAFLPAQAHDDSQGAVRIRVRQSPTAGWVTGRLAGLRGDTLILLRGQEETRARIDTLVLDCRAAVDTGHVVGHYTGTGALVGYVGTGLAFTIVHHNSNEDPTGAVLALVGGAVGAVYGSGIDRVRWFTLRPAACTR